jgi:ATP-dependent helicase/nuclease subunit B
LGHLDDSDAADAMSFKAVVDHTRDQLGKLADGILDGDVTVRPYRLGNFSPCSWCAMSSVCRFEMGVSDVRFLESLRQSEVFRRLAGTRPQEASSQ